MDHPGPFTTCCSVELISFSACSSNPISEGCHSHLARFTWEEQLVWVSAPAWHSINLKAKKKLRNTRILHKEIVSSTNSRHWMERLCHQKWPRISTPLGSGGSIVYQWGKHGLCLHSPIKLPDKKCVVWGIISGWERHEDCVVGRADNWVSRLQRRWKKQ